MRAADLLVAALKNSRPEALDPAAQERPVEVLLLNLMAAPTGMAGVPQGRLISRAYSANLVASPEDRRAADQMDRFVRPRENLVTWAMAQAGHSRRDLVGIVRRPVAPAAGVGRHGGTRRCLRATLHGR